MSIFNKAFNQFKKDGLKLALFNLVYFFVVLISSVTLGAILPLMSSFLGWITFSIFTTIYIRLYMQVINEKKYISFDNSMESIICPGLRVALLYFIQGLIVGIVTMICVTFMMIDRLDTLLNESIRFSLIGLTFNSFTILLLLVLIIYFGLRLLFAFTDLLIMDKDFANTSFKDCIKNGIKIAKGYRLNYILLQIFHIVLSFLGILAFGVGIIFTEALYTLLLLNLYRKAKENYFGCGNLNENINIQNDSKYESEINFDDFLEKY